MGMSIRGCLAAWLLAALVIGARAQDSADERHRAFDRQLHLALREMHNKGADLYNGGDPGGCYRVFQGGLLTAKGVLTYRPEVQKLIEERMADADKEASLPRRAFALHQLIEDVRGLIRPSDIRAGDTDAGRSPSRRAAESGSAVRPPANPPSRTLWERLGGESGVRKIVDEFVVLAVADLRVDFTRGGKHPLTAETAAHLKKELVDFVSQAAGGPYRYAGRGMKEEHRGMAITDAEFDALVADLKQSLRRNQVPPEDADALLGLAEATRKDIVEPPGPKPPGPAIPADKKPGPTARKPRP